MGYLEKDCRQLPENRGEQLVPEALNMIRMVAHADPDIHLVLGGLSDGELQAFKEAETVETFREAILSAISDRSIFVIAGALEVLDTAVDVMSGRSDSNTDEENFDGNEEVVSHFRQVKATAKDILQGLRSDILNPESQKQPILTY